MPYRLYEGSGAFDLSFTSLVPLELTAWRKPEPDEDADPRAVTLKIEIEKDSNQLAVTAEVYRSSKLATCKVKLLAIFRSDGEEDLSELSDTSITRFADEVLTNALWPYLRENMLRLTGQLGIRSMGLPLTPPILPYKEALERGASVVTDGAGNIRQ